MGGGSIREKPFYFQKGSPVVSKGLLWVHTRWTSLCYFLNTSSWGLRPPVGWWKAWPAQFCCHSSLRPLLAEPLTVQDNKGVPLTQDFSEGDLCAWVWKEESQWHLWPSGANMERRVHRTLREGITQISWFGVWAGLVPIFCLLNFLAGLYLPLVCACYLPFTTPVKKTEQNCQNYPLKPIVLKFSFLMWFLTKYSMSNTISFTTLPQLKKWGQMRQEHAIWEIL